MDLLKKEMERKKKALQEAKQSASSADASGRYFKAGELRRLQEEREEEERRKRKQHESGVAVTSGKKRSRTESAEGTKEERNDRAPTKTEKPSSSSAREEDGPSSTTIVTDASTLTPQQVSDRFRSLGLPIRLFGELTIARENDTFQDDARLQRLQQALDQQSKTLASLSEMDEYRLGKGHGIRNPFLEKDVADNSAAVAASIEQDAGKSKEESSASKQTTKDETPAQEKDDSDDPHKYIYKYFKGLLREWEEELAQRPDDVKRTVAGKNETKTLKQCKDYIRPLFKLCKSRRLEEGLTASLVKIVDNCKEGEFVRAHDQYLDIAIGRAAWPIGVTQVGIHSRTGRSKIESQNVAHVMNSELQRKYLTSVKRLMSYAQKKRTDVDPSKKVV